MAATRKLYRSKTSRQLAGMVLYIALWIIVPREP